MEQVEEIVLAFSPRSKCSRYATWALDSSGTGVHSGRYFERIDRAVSDFLERSGKEKEE